MRKNESTEEVCMSHTGPSSDEQTRPGASHSGVAPEDRTSAADLLVMAYQARVRQGLTQKQVASAMGTTQSAVSELESGQSAPTLGTLLRYGWALGLNIEWADQVTNSDTGAGTHMIPVTGLNEIASEILKELAVPARRGGKLAGPRGLLGSTPQLGEHDKSWASKTLESLAKHELVKQEADRSYTFAADNANIVGLSVHEDSVYAVLLGLDGDNTQGTALKSLPSDPSIQNVVDACTSLVEELVAESPQPVLGIGVSIAGVVDHNNGLVRQAPALNSARHNWRDVPLRRLLEQSIQAQTGKGLRVVVENDVNALARGEHIRSGEVDIVTILVSGIGVGAGIISHGELTEGANDAAGEIGHVIVDFNGSECSSGYPHRGCVETVATPAAILKKLRLPSFTKKQRRRELEELNQSGDLPAEVKDLFRSAGESLRKAVSDLVLVVDPAQVVIFVEETLSNRDQYETAELYQKGFDVGGDYTNHRRPDFVQTPRLTWRPLSDDTRARAACAAAFWEFLSKPTEWVPDLQSDILAEVRILEQSTTTIETLSSHDGRAVHS